MRLEARVDERIFFRFGIEHRQRAVGFLQRENLRRRKVRSLLAPVGIVRPANGGGKPDAAILIQHGIVVVDLGVPDFLHAPVGRWAQRCGRCRMPRPKRLRRVGVAHRRVEIINGIRFHIQDRNIVGGIFRRSIERAIGVDGWIAFVGRYAVMQILLLVAPVPCRDDDVALDARWALRLCLRQFAIGDALRPVAKIFVRRAAKLAGENAHHGLAALPRLRAAHPRILVVLVISKPRRNRARRQLSKLVAADTAVVLHQEHPVVGLHIVGNIALAAELVGRRHLQHRVPVDRRIILRRRFFIRRRNRSEIERCARLCIHMRGINEAVAAHPNLVFRFRQIRQRIAPGIIGHDHLCKTRRQILRLGDDPHARFRPLGPAHDARNIISALRNCPARHRHGDDGCGSRQKLRSDSHVSLPDAAPPFRRRPY